jgi:tellurium resistance protein TerD
MTGQVQTLVKSKPTSLVKAAGADSGGMYYCGLGWDLRTTDGAPYDLDGHAFILGKDRKVLGATAAEKAHNWVFWGNKQSATGAVIISPDNKDGKGEGDDEWLKIITGKLPADANEVLIAVNMYLDPSEIAKLKAAGRLPATFGEVDNALFHIAELASETDGPDGKPVLGKALTAPFYMGVDVADMRCAIFVSLVRHPGDPNDWMVKAIEAGYADGVDALAMAHGINLQEAVKELGLTAQ